MCLLGPTCVIMSRPQFPFGAVGRSRENDACEMLCELNGPMDLFHSTKPFPLAGQNGVQNNRPLCCLLYIRGDETADREAGHPSDVCSEKSHLPAESGLEWSQARWLAFV